MRNHILLKWLQACNAGGGGCEPSPERMACIASLYGPPGGGGVWEHHPGLPGSWQREWDRAGLRVGAPWEAGWGAHALATGPGAAALRPRALPRPLTLASVIATLPLRLHELTAAVFEFLQVRESRVSLRVACVAESCVCR